MVKDSGPIKGPWAKALPSLWCPSILQTAGCLKVEVVASSIHNERPKAPLKKIWKWYRFFRVEVLTRKMRWEARTCNPLLEVTRGFFKGQSPLGYIKKTSGQGTYQQVLTKRCAELYEEKNRF